MVEMPEIQNWWKSAPGIPQVDSYNAQHYGRSVRDSKMMLLQFKSALRPNTKAQSQSSEALRNKLQPVHSTTTLDNPKPTKPQNQTELAEKQSPERKVAYSKQNLNHV